MGRGANTVSQPVVSNRLSGFKKPEELTPAQERVLSFIQELPDHGHESELLDAEIKFTLQRIASGDIWDIFRESSPQLSETLQQLIDTQKTYAGMPLQTKAVEYYVGSGYREINKGLRRQIKLSGEVDHYHQALSQLFSALPTLQSDLLVTRRIDKNEAAEFGFSKVSIDTMYSGVEITERGYLSTSANILRLGPSAEQISMLIVVPAGSRALAVQAFDAWTPDKEVLLPPDSKLQVEHRREHSDGAVSLFARLLN